MIQNKAILIVDSENHTLRILKDLLIENGFVVYFAPNCTLAMQIAIKDLPDLILSEIVLEDMDGREFMKTMHHAPETSEIPFIFLTSRTLPTDKVSALDAGAEDYLTKPFNETELLARIHVVLRRYDKRPVTALTEEEGIKGDLKDINLIDFVQLFDMGRKTATLEIAGEDREGRIYFEGGEIIHAVSGKLFGKEALYDLFAIQEGSFMVHLNVSSQIRTIQEGSTNLMMEIMHHLDEQGIHPVVSGSEKRTPPERSSLHNEGIRELFEKGVIEEFTKG